MIGVYGGLVPLLGGIITLMNMVNSRLSDRVGYLAAALVIHVVGFAVLSGLVLARREAAKPGKIPFYYYFGGLLGVGTVLSSNYAYSALDASLAVSLSLLGQTLLSLVADSTGLLGRTRYPLSLRRLPGITLAFTGAVAMAGEWQTRIPAILAALASGAIPGFTFILNSELGRRKGIFRSALWNYRMGLAATLVIVTAVRPPLAQAARAAVDAGPFLVLGGGLLGAGVIAAMNLIYPRIPAFSATLLLFSGQAFTGIVIDVLAKGGLDLRMLAGTCTVVAGLALYSAASAWENRPRPSAGTPSPPIPPAPERPES